MLKIYQYACFLFIILCVNACSPKFNWREINNEEPRLSILFPAKPSVFSRDIQLDKHTVSMNMMAVDIDGAHFSLAYVKVNKNDEDLQQQKTLQQELIQLMQKGMLKNINETKIESRMKNSIVAIGNLTNGKKINMYGRFDIHGDWLIQTIILAEDKKISEEEIEMFLNSLSLK